METILLLKRILSGINLVALATRRTHILRFTTHSWRQLGSGVARITGQGGPKNIRGGQLKQDEN